MKVYVSEVNINCGLSNCIRWCAGIWTYVPVHCCDRLGHRHLAAVQYSTSNVIVPLAVVSTLRNDDGVVEQKVAHHFFLFSWVESPCNTLPNLLGDTRNRPTSAHIFYNVDLVYCCASSSPPQPYKRKPNWKTFRRFVLCTQAERRTRKMEALNSFGDSIVAWADPEAKFSGYTEVRWHHVAVQDEWKS